MTRRAGIRRWVRWGSFAAVVILTLVWGASLFGYVGYTGSLDVRGFYIGHGSFNYHDYSGAFVWMRTGWSAGVYNESPTRSLIWLPHWGPRGLADRMNAPLWIPWLLAAGFTAWRFRADRVKPLHACPSCGYDKTGLVAGAACPECGAGAA
jgi:hypothetical protein